MKTVIWFDFDGTIVNVKKRFYRVHLALCGHFKIHPLPENQYWDARCNGVSTLEILKKINAENVYEKYIEERNKLIEAPEFLKYDRLRDGVVATLESLKAKHDFYILSGRMNRDNLVEQINWLGLSKYFSKIFAVSPYSGWEEKCQVLKNNFTPGNIMVGDHPKDIIAGKQAQIKTVAILDGMSVKANIESTSPDYTIDAFPGILKLGIV